MEKGYGVLILLFMLYFGSNLIEFIVMLFIPKKKESELTDLQKVNRDIELKILEAEKKGLPRLTTDLYATCKRYPQWMNRRELNIVPASILDASIDHSESDQHKSLIVKIKNGNFKFILTPLQKYSQTKFAKLELLWNDSLVFELEMSFDSEEETAYTSPDWYPRKILAYIAGDWQNELQGLQNAIHQHDQELRQLKENNPQLIRDLKNRFGV